MSANVPESAPRRVLAVTELPALHLVFSNEHGCERVRREERLAVRVDFGVARTFRNDINVEFSCHKT
jgi:hypothetical protein